MHKENEETPTYTPVHTLRSGAPGFACRSSLSHNALRSHHPRTSGCARHAPGAGGSSHASGSSPSRQARVPGKASWSCRPRSSVSACTSGSPWRARGPCPARLTAPTRGARRTRPTSATSRATRTYTPETHKTPLLR